MLFVCVPRDGVCLVCTNSRHGEKPRMSYLCTEPTSVGTCVCWNRCGHCKKLEPEFEEAAKKLQDSVPAVALAKVDATTSKPLANTYVHA